MKKLILGIFTLLICSNVFSQGIKFEKGKLSDALAKAKVDNKLVFVDVYTKW